MERSSADRITVPMKNMDASKEPEVGDTLEIVYDGMIAESYPAQITNVYSIDVVKKGDGTSSFLIPVIHHHYIV